MRVSRRIALFVGLALIGACKRTPRTTGIEEELPEAAPVVPKVDGTASQVKLIDAGKEPRQALRFSPPVGKTEVATMRLTNSIRMTVGAEEMPAQVIPAVVIDVSLTVKDVSPQGDISYEFVFTRAHIEEGGDPSMGMVLEPMVAALKGMGGSGVANARGVSKAIDVKIPADVDERTRQLLTSIREAVAQVTPPLPEEAVGVGARWQETATLVSDGLKITRTAQYHLESLEGGVAKISVEAQNVGDASGFKPSNVPEGATVKIQSYQGTGKAELLVDPKRLFVASKQTGATTVEMFISTPGEDKVVKTVTTQDVTFGEIPAAKADASK